MNDSAREFRSANSAIPEEGLTLEPLSFSSACQVAIEFSAFRTDKRRR